MPLASRIKTALYRRPLDELRRLRRWGPLAYLRNDAWASAMERHARDELRPLPAASSAAPPVEAFFMTGARHWHQTALCAWSLQRHLSAPLLPRILDDGTLAPAQEHRLRELFPLLSIESRPAADARVARHLPPARYPRIHAWRGIQILFRKLTDIHVGSTEWRLFLDSDMLFFSPPAELETWWQKPDRGIFQTDCVESYGYTRPLAEKLAGARLLDSVNIGIFSLDGTLVDWDEVERWLGAMETAEGRRYNITQCVTTMLLSRLPTERLDAQRYHVFPGPGHPRPARPPVLRHYVADAKPHYHRQAWRDAVQP